MQFFEDKFNLSIEASLGFSDALKFFEQNSFRCETRWKLGSERFSFVVGGLKLFSWLVEKVSPTNEGFALFIVSTFKAPDANIYLGLFFFKSALS